MATTTKNHDGGKYYGVFADAPEMVSVRVPKRAGDPAAFVNVGINGRFFQVRVGVDVSVPVEIRDLLRDGGYLDGEDAFKAAIRDAAPTKFE